MPAPPDLTRMARALLEPNDREIIDRATLLPIGQYEDGSLTFAWPGFLKDAYDGAVRSAVAQEGAPLYDDGGQYVSGAQMQPLDAFNAASIAPVAGVGMRAAGMAAGPTRDAFMAENLVRQFPEEKVISGGNPIGNNWFGVGGESFWDSSRGLSKLHELPRASRTNGMSWDPVKPPQNDLAGPMTDYDLSALSQAWRNKVRNTGEFFANPDNASLPAIGLNALEQPKGIRAYHGSPHDFDKFDISKIGTGEGAQAYGHGLYFAENEGVARSYRDALSGGNIGYGPDVIPEVYKPGNIINTRFGKDKILAYKPGVGDWDFQVSVQAVDDAGKPIGRPRTHSTLPTYQMAVDTLGAERVGPKGRMYEVNINAQPEQFLDWDKPLWDQPSGINKAFPEAVSAYTERYAPKDLATLQKALKDEYAATVAKNAGNPDSNTWDWSSYQAASRALDDATAAPMNAWHYLNKSRDPRETASRLREAGIPGIRYLDQGSRLADDGTYNYVVFDDSLIDIMRKYANPPEAGLPSLLGQSQQDTQLASADPQYDAYDLLQQMRRPPPSPFWIDFQALDQQQMMDPPQMTIPPERQSPERLIPLRDKW